MEENQITFKKRLQARLCLPPEQNSSGWPGTVRNIQELIHDDAAAGKRDWLSE